jgi:hypothetical protein
MSNFRVRFLCTVALAIGSIASAEAQSLVVNGFFDCQRATNGRAYCKRQGAPTTTPWAPVGDDFFAKYEAARNGAPPAPASPAVVTQQSASEVTNNVIVVNMATEAADAKGQIKVLENLLREQSALIVHDGDSYSLQESIKEIQARLDAAKSVLHEKTVELSKYQSSIKPDDSDSAITARRESEIQTKIPYYIPGTVETGEFWVEPLVNDEGGLEFKFQFVDVNSNSADKIRSTIRMDADQMAKTKGALLKAAEDSKKAHDKGIRREVSVRLSCFPEADCPLEGQKLKGKASTEVKFEVHQDGSTNARIQRNKGEFEEGYNVSIGSALLLQAYINHVLSAGVQEHEMGSASVEKLQEMFK